MNIKDGGVFFDDIEIARLENLKYIQKNVYYQKESRKLALLQEELEKKHLLSDEHPENQEYRTEYLSSKKQYAQLQQKICQYQVLIFDVAKRIAKLQGQNVSKRMRRAIEAFEEGKIHEANVILDGIEHEANLIYADYIESKGVTEQKWQNVIRTIEELKTKISTMKTDEFYSIEERIEKIEKMYLQIVEIAKEVYYGKREYVELIYEFAYFYTRISQFGNAEKCYEEILNILQDGNIYKHSRLDIANVYICLGEVRGNLHRDVNAITMDFDTALCIVRTIVQEDKKYLPCLASSLCVVSNFCISTKNYLEAKTYCSEAVGIYNLILSDQNVHYEIDYAKALSQLASILDDINDPLDMGDIEKYYQKAMEIFELEDSKVNMAKTFINRGNYYFKRTLYKLAEQDYVAALSILDSLNNEIDIFTIWGDKAKTFCNIADVYKKIDIELYKENIEQEYRDALSIYIDLESINYGTFLSKIKKVVGELGFFYQIFADKENINELEKVVLNRLSYLDSKANGQYRKTISDISAMLLKYKNAIT